MTKTFTWVRDEADQLVCLERYDSRDASTSFAMIDNNGRLDPHFRDTNGFLKGIVSEAHQKEFKAYAKNS